MESNMRDTFLSVTGQSLEKRLWLPSSYPKGIVQLVHGMAEHIDRYEETALYLNAAGFAVTGHTHLGHGPQAETLGYFAAEDGWNALIDDTHALRQQVSAQYPDVPYFLLGHSMGSFVVRTYCLEYEKGLAGVILSGTGHFPPPIVGFGKLVASISCAFGAEKKPNLFLQNVSNAGYNDKYDSPRTKFDWLSAHEPVVDAYIADPFCGFPFTSGGFRDMFDGLSRLYPPSLSVMEKDIPVYLFAGAHDPVGKYGAGVKKVAAELKAAGVKDVSVKLYEGGRHEMFNELDKQTVWTDLILWMQKVLS